MSFPNDPTFNQDVHRLIAISTRDAAIASYDESRVAFVIARVITTGRGICQPGTGDARKIERLTSETRD